MDMTNLMISLVAGLAGMGMLMFAKSARRLVPVAAGLGLMICPYFIASTVLLVAVCVAFLALPFVVREA
jgi:hypothetical protein